MKIANIAIDIPQKNAAIIVRALLPELKETPQRTDVKIKVYPEKLELRIAGKDTPALRAGLNSYLRWVELIIELQKRIKLRNRNAQPYGTN